MTQLHSYDHNLPDPPDTPITKHAPGAEGKGNPIRLAILAAVIALVGLWGGWSLAIVILGVVFMIFLHELGHYLAAKWSDMKVTEFFIGFGPKIWSFQRGETEYGLKVIPAGAYVKIIGMSTLEEVDPEEEDRTYRVKSYPRRLLVAVAGSAMHFAQALILLFLIYAFVGMPGGSMVSERWEVAEVVEGSAAETAGLQMGDQVRAIDGESINSFIELASTVSSRPGEEVVLSVSRDGDRLAIPVTIGVRDGNPEAGFLGVGHERLTVKTGPVAAIGESFREFGAVSSATVGYLTSFFSPSGLSDFASSVTDRSDAPGSVVEAPPDPSSSSSDQGSSSSADTSDDGRLLSIIGAVHLGSTLTESGMQGFLVFFVLINIAIGIFNLLPVLPLDGGHVVVATYERIRELFTPTGERHYVDMARLAPFVYVVFVGLIMLGFTMMYLDIVDPIL